MPFVTLNILEVPGKRNGGVGISSVRNSVRKSPPHRSRQNELEKEKDNARKESKGLAKLPLTATTIHGTKGNT